MYLLHIVQEATVQSLANLYGKPFTTNDFQVNQTKPEFEGDFTIVLFALSKKVSTNPAAIGEALGQKMIADHPQYFSAYNVIKGFLNLSVSDAYWSRLLLGHYNDVCFGKQASNGKKVMVEYASPNTNKPLHLGHLRNIFLGWSIAEILKAAGYTVYKSSIVNDRGIHICKSMYAWQQFAHGATPQSTGVKGDHLVGNYYVKFEDLVKSQVAEIKQKENEGVLDYYTTEQQQKITQLQQIKNGLAVENDPANNDKIKKIDAELNDMRRAATPAMHAAKSMLQKWEAGDADTLNLWRTMNGWVYEGMDQTYQKIGADFDKTYYESNTYLVGKEIVAEGLQKEVFYRRADGSVWIDLTGEGLDEKLVLRSDGTSVYITQDIGLAKQKAEEYGIDKSIYVIGDEQNYHMKVLQLICRKLGVESADDMQHLSYGMVELPDGKMKSREGTVVDADDIVAEMEKEAAAKTEALGKVQDFTPDELEKLYTTIGLGALKFFLLRVDPKKRMVFNPEESIDFHGFTAPFIQFNFARMQSVLRKNLLDESWRKNQLDLPLSFLPLEKELIATLEKYPATILQACTELNPSVIAIYVYHVAKTFSSFYTEHAIGNAESEHKKQLRLHLCSLTANVLQSGMQLLGIALPDRM